ncbi:MAG: hypothetical protein ACM3NT_08370 [Methylocystaceae bacterium]
MPGQTRITINVPERLILEMSALELDAQLDYNGLFLEAMQYYLGERKRKLMLEQMRRGYMEMGEINLAVCFEYTTAEGEALAFIERYAE